MAVFSAQNRSLLSRNFFKILLYFSLSTPLLSQKRGTLLIFPFNNVKNPLDILLKKSFLCKLIVVYIRIGKR